MPIQPVIKTKGMTRAKKGFNKLLKRTKDLRPVFKEFLKWQTKEYADGVWDTRGKALGQGWENYRSAAYVKKKGRKTANLILTGRLRDAAKGKSGWIQKIDKKTFAFGISDSIEYAAIHQYGKESRNMAQRSYLFSRDDDLSPRQWVTLLQMTEEYLGGGFK